MRYTGSVSNAFVQSMAHNFVQALRLMEAALTDCPDELWQTDLWPDEAPTAPTPHGGLHGSAPWFLGYHALNTLDYDLAGEFEPWAPPQPFDDNTYGFPNRRFTKPELLGYVDWCRGRVRQTLDGLTEEMAARPLPGAHRYHGMLFAVIVDCGWCGVVWCGVVPARPGRRSRPATRPRSSGPAGWLTILDNRLDQFTSSRWRSAEARRYLEC